MGERYQRAARGQRSALLDEVMRVWGYPRQDAMGLFGRAVPPQPSIRQVARRRPTDSEDVIRLLAQVWEASGYLCAQRLTAALPPWLPWLRRHARITPTLEAQRVQSSPRQLDRRLRARKHRIKRRLSGTTRPGSLLKQQIPIKTDHWDVTPPGDLEIDRVSPSGASASGELLHTLDCVDIHTTWVERQAGLGKGQHGILQALTLIEGRLPFALRGLDSDKGSACITAHLVACCQRPGGHAIQFTRSRPYKKDDHAPSEQKNWTPVRTLVGWERDDTPAARAALTMLYADLRLFQNLFQPSMTLQSKERRGSRLIRRYDMPRTPFERVHACPDADSQKVSALARLLATTDPFVLSQRIDQHLEQLWALATRAPRTPREVAPRAPQPRASTPWRGWTFSPKAPRPSSASAGPTVNKPAHTVGSGATITRPAKGAARKKSAARGAGVSGKMFR